MKCLCGFQQKPDNVRILKAHLEDCLTTGALKDLFPEPYVVWRQEFRVVKELENEEAPIDLGMEIKRAPAGVQRIEKKLAAAEAGRIAIVQSMEGSDHEEIVAALEDPASVSGETEEVVEEAPKPKPAPKKKAPAKKKSSTTKK